MVKRETLHSRDEELCEGPPSPAQPKDARSRFEPASPVARVPARGGPAGETGVLPVVVFAEGDDLGETQDASRTTAENRAVPVSEDDVTMLNGRHPNVLIVEDTFELAKLIQLALSRSNIPSVIETSGTLALERFYELRPNVVLLDLGLPDMTGWKVLDAIRESVQDSSAMPAVIVITAYGDAANRLVGKLQNVRGYLVKPFTADDVTRAVRQALNTRV